MSTPIQTPTTDPAPEPLLEFRNVMKIYGAGEGEVRALGGVSFQILPGEFVAMMGPSGSGKSTTMNICLLYTSPECEHGILRCPEQPARLGRAGGKAVADLRSGGSYRWQAHRDSFRPGYAGHAPHCRSIEGR